MQTLFNDYLGDTSSEKKFELISEIISMQNWK